MQQRAEHVGEVGLAAGSGDLVDAVHQQAVGGGEAFALGGRNGQAAHRVEEFGLPDVGELRGVGRDGHLCDGLREQFEFWGEAGVTEAFCQQHFEECRRQRNAAEAHLLDFQALLADAQPGLDIDEAAGPHVGKEGRQRGGVADVGAALAQRERGVALDAAAGGKVEQGFEVGAAEADVTGAAGGHSARIVLAQDSLRPADGGRRQFVRGDDQGPHFEGLDAQQDQGCQRQHDAGRQPGKETEHWGLG